MSIDVSELLKKFNMAFMKKLLYPLTITMLITLAFGYFGHPARNFSQILLVIAMLAVLSSFIFSRKSKKSD
jgi:lipopolysaccharide export LptBFGC system permease protein LptF